MKILVLGATGGTGQLIVRAAAQSGHSVAALVRAKAGADLPGAKLIEGEVRDEATLVRALDSCDAVVSALGTYQRPSAWPRQGHRRPRRR